MAIYTMSAASSVARLKRVKWWMIGISAAGLTISLLVILIPSAWSGAHLSHELQRAIFIVFIASFVILVQTASPWGNAFKRGSEIQKGLCVEVTSDEIEVRSGIYSSSIRRDEIVRAEESSGRGLFLRTSDRYRWIFIPRRIDGYQDIKDNLTASGTPVVESKILPNWEEFLFVILFCASLICDLATHNRSILLVNLAVAVLTGAFGTISARNYRDNPKLRLRVILGGMIPAAMALLAVLSPFGMF